MTAPLQNAVTAATPVDPNTMVAANPAKQTSAAQDVVKALSGASLFAPGIGALGSIADERQKFSDSWADPTSSPTTRVWRDPTQRNAADGEYLSAWYDEPAQDQQAPQPAFNDAAAAANASAIKAQAEAAKPASGAAPAAGTQPVQPLVDGHLDWNSERGTGA